MSMINSNYPLSNTATVNTATTIATHIQPSKMPNLVFKLYHVENGYILEIIDSTPDPTHISNGYAFERKSKMYILNEIENLGSTIEKIISIYLLQK